MTTEPQTHADKVRHAAASNGWVTSEDLIYSLTLTKTYPTGERVLRVYFTRLKRVSSAYATGPDKHRFYVHRGQDKLGRLLSYLQKEGPSTTS